MGWSRASKHVHLPVGISCLYAAELANGIVKVGLTRNPRGRIPSLYSHARTRFGVEVVRYELSKPFPERNRHLLWVAESELLQGLRRIGREDDEHGEFFHGLRFDSTVVLMEQVVWRFLEVSARLDLQAKQSRVVSSGPLVSHEPNVLFFGPDRVHNPVQQP